MLEISSQALSGFLINYPSAVVVDVRFANERDEYGYMNVSHHVPLFTGDWEPNPDFATALSAVAPPDAIVLFVCRSGNRSRVAGEMAAEQGYTQIYNITGGHVALLELAAIDTSLNALLTIPTVTA
ncbi:MAG: hypothetical protein HOP20_01465 [Sulfuriferula sp.]|nr:hypothetical protein [Sulfuriferula sp.]